MTKKILCLLLCAVMLVSTLVTGTVVSAAENQRFTDVKPGNWFYEAVEYVASKGIVDGMGDGKFKPKSQMTRAQFVTILARLAGADVKGLGATLNFTDIKGTEWFADYVGWSVKTGLVGGYPEGDFRANKAISRQELAKLFVSYMEYIGYEIKDPAPLTDKFTDAKKLPSWSKQYIEGLRACGLIGGDADGNFNPTATATRAEVATILQRFLETEPDKMYAAQQSFILENTCATHGKVEFTLTGTVDFNYDYLSSMLLREMGLPECEYEIMMSRDEINDLKEELVGVNLDVSFDFTLPFRVLNVVTGEYTGEVSPDWRVQKRNNMNEDTQCFICNSTLSTPSMGKYVKAYTSEKLDVVAYPDDCKTAEDAKKLIAEAVLEDMKLDYGLCDLVIDNEEAFLKAFTTLLGGMKAGEAKTLGTKLSFKVSLWTDDASSNCFVPTTAKKELTLNVTRAAGKDETPAAVLAELGTDAEASLNAALTANGAKLTGEKADAVNALKALPAGESTIIRATREVTDPATGKKVEKSLDIIFCAPAAELSSDADFVLVKDSKAMSTIVIGSRCSLKTVEKADAFARKLFESTGAAVRIITEDKLGKVVTNGNVIFFGKNDYMAMDSAALGEATSYDFVVKPYGNYFVALGRTEYGSYDAFEYLEKNIALTAGAPTTSAKLSGDKFGIFERELDEVKHAFPDKFQTSFYGDPYIHCANAEEAYNDVDTFNDILDYGVVEVHMSSKSGDLSDPKMIEYRKKLIGKLYENGVSVRFYACSSSCYEFLNKDMDLDNIDPSVYAAAEENIKKIVEIYGDVEGISCWGYYDEPLGKAQYTENKIIKELFNKYDDRDRPVYVNLGPSNWVTLDEYIDYSEIADPDFYCYDRYPFFYEDGEMVPGKITFYQKRDDVPDESANGKITLGESDGKGDFYIGTLELREKDWYENLELNRDFALDFGRDAGIIVAGMKVGGGREEDRADLTLDTAKWKTNMIVAYGYRYYESYVYYHVHEYSILGENNIPTWRWYMMRDRNLYLNNVANLMLDSGLETVFHLPNKDGTYDVGTTPYYPYHGLGEIDGTDEILSFFADGRLVLTDKRCDDTDGDAHEITVKDFGAYTKWYNVETSTWDDISTCSAVKLNGTTATITMERASQLIFGSNE